MREMFERMPDENEPYAVVELVEIDRLLSECAALKAANRLLRGVLDVVRAIPRERVDVYDSAVGREVAWFVVDAAVLDAAISGFVETPASHGVGNEG